MACSFSRMVEASGENCFFQFTVLVLSGKSFGPEEGEIKMAASVVDLIHFSGRRFVFVKDGTDRFIKAICQYFRFGIARFFGQVFEGNRDG